MAFKDLETIHEWFSELSGSMEDAVFGHVHEELALNAAREREARKFRPAPKDPAVLERLRVTSTERARRFREKTKQDPEKLRKAREYKAKKQAEYRARDRATAA